MASNIIERISMGCSPPQSVNNNYPSMSPIFFNICFIFPLFQPGATVLNLMNGAVYWILMGEIM